MIALSEELQAEETELRKEKRLMHQRGAQEKKAMQDLFGNMSLFALKKVNNELAYAWKNAGQYTKEDDCICTVRVNYGLPCQYIIASNGFEVRITDTPDR